MPPLLNFNAPFNGYVMPTMGQPTGFGADPLPQPPDDFTPPQPPPQSFTPIREQFAPLVDRVMSQGMGGRMGGGEPPQQSGGFLNRFLGNLGVRPEFANFQSGQTGQNALRGIGIALDAMNAYNANKYRNDLMSTLSPIEAMKMQLAEQELGLRQAELARKGYGDEAGISADALDSLSNMALKSEQAYASNRMADQRGAKTEDILANIDPHVALNIAKAATEYSKQDLNQAHGDMYGDQGGMYRQHGELYGAKADQTNALTPSMVGAQEALADERGSKADYNRARTDTENQKRPWTIQQIKARTNEVLARTRAIGRGGAKGAPSRDLDIAMQSVRESLEQVDKYLNTPDSQLKAPMAKGTKGKNGQPGEPGEREVLARRRDELNGRMKELQAEYQRRNPMPQADEFAVNDDDGSLIPASPTPTPTATPDEALPSAGQLGPPAAIGAPPPGATGKAKKNGQYVGWLVNGRVIGFDGQPLSR